MAERHIDYPAELTFKSVFRNRLDILQDIEGVLEARGISAAIHSRQSSNGKFISYTVTAAFGSEEELRQVCDAVAAIPGFMTMF